MKCLFRNIMMAVLLLWLVGCGFEKEVLISGNTMGTTYHVKVVAGYFDNTAALRAKLEKRLDEINQSMSTYIETSEISRFNRMRPGDKALSVSVDFMNVFTEARRLFELTGGAWDGTVKPLVDLWGFGNPDHARHIPDGTRIESLKAAIGFDHIGVSPGGITKAKAGISLDFASIAKGYAVDQLARTIRAGGFDRFLVEIGGEVYASACRKDGSPWRVGINQPDKHAPLDLVYQVVTLSERAMATSGDYRNFFTINGRTYSHVIDPRTGFPVDNGVVSASITADTCMFADGLATAVMVMGHQKGLALVNRLAHVEGLIIVRQKDGRLSAHYSSGFKILSENQKKRP